MTLQQWCERYNVAPSDSYGRSRGFENDEMLTVPHWTGTRRRRDAHKLLYLLSDYQVSSVNAGTVYLVSKEYLVKKRQERR